MRRHRTHYDVIVMILKKADRCGDFLCSLLSAWTTIWANSRVSGFVRRHGALVTSGDITIMTKEANNVVRWSCLCIIHMNLVISDIQLSKYIVYGWQTALKYALRFWNLAGRVYLLISNGLFLAIFQCAPYFPIFETSDAKVYYRGLEDDTWIQVPKIVVISFPEVIHTIDINISSGEI